MAHSRLHSVLMALLLLSLWQCTAAQLVAGRPGRRLLAGPQQPQPAAASATDRSTGGRPQVSPTPSGTAQTQQPGTTAVAQSGAPAQQPRVTPTPPPQSAAAAPPPAPTKAAPAAPPAPPATAPAPASGGSRAAAASPAPALRPTPATRAAAAPRPAADTSVASSVAKLPYTPVEGSGTTYEGCVWADAAGGGVPKPHGAVEGHFQCCNGAWIKGGCGGDLPGQND